MSKLPRVSGREPSSRKTSSPNVNIEVTSCFGGTIPSLKSSYPIIVNSIRELCEPSSVRLASQLKKLSNCFSQWIVAAEADTFASSSFGKVA